MEGKDCPRCGKVSDWLATTNEWEYHCPDCDIRFNKHDKVVTRQDSWRIEPIKPKPLKTFIGDHWNAYKLNK